MTGCLHAKEGISVDFSLSVVSRRTRQEAV